jgi:hypothetical protein
VLVSQRGLVEKVLRLGRKGSKGLLAFPRSLVRVVRKDGDEADQSAAKAFGERGEYTCAVLISMSHDVPLDRHTQCVWLSSKSSDISFGT